MIRKNIKKIVLGVPKVLFVGEKKNLEEKNQEYPQQKVGKSREVSGVGRVKIFEER